MRLNAKDILFGQPILKIRAVIRNAMGGRLNYKHRGGLDDKLAEIMGTSKPIARDVLKQLLDEGYLELQKETIRTNTTYRITETEKGRRLGIATANPAITRQKADGLLNEIIEKAKHINATKELVYYVESIKVFGSYLSEKELLGDIDVAVKLSKRYEGDTFRQQIQKRIDLAFQNGRRFANIIDRYCWPHREVMLLLKSKKKGLSLHDEGEDDVVNQTETRIVYEFYL